MPDEIKCPKCGSAQITANKKGFSAGKAAAGFVAAGGIGLAAGAIGKNKIVITCLNCGHQFRPGEGEKEPVLPAEDTYKSNYVAVKLTDDALCDIIRKQGTDAAIDAYMDAEAVSKEDAVKKVEMVTAIYKVTPGPLRPSSSKSGCLGIAFTIAFTVLIVLLFVRAFSG